MKLSIITINYDNREGLERTFRSVFAQTSKDFEYVVIDGGSNDGSKELIEKNAEKISYWVSEKDKGIYNAMNKGIVAAKGEYLLFLNSGDELFPDPKVLENIFPQLNGSDVISGDLQIVEKDGKIWINRNPEVLQFRTLFQYTLLHPCTFIKKQAFETVGFYDENLKIVSDWKWFLLALGKFGLSYQKIPEVVAVFYADGVSSNPENRGKLLEERRKTIAEHFPLFVEDYTQLISNEYDSRVLSLMNRSRWTKLGKKIGLLKKAEKMEADKKFLFL